MRQQLQDLQVTMQQQHQQQAVMIQQLAHVTDAAARAMTTERERAVVASIAAEFAARADDGDIIDNKALGQPFKYTVKDDSHFAEWDHKIRISIRARFGQEILEATSWAERQQKPIVKVVSLWRWRCQSHCLP